MKAYLPDVASKFLTEGLIYGVVDRCKYASEIQSPTEEMFSYFTTVNATFLDC